MGKIPEDSTVHNHRHEKVKSFTEENLYWPHLGALKQNRRGNNAWKEERMNEMKGGRNTKENKKQKYWTQKKLVRNGL
jgi:hypothetical protein